jgi:hypothetical protein
VPRLDSTSVFLVGIVGVPWQDIADDESLTDPVKLKYLTAAEIAERGIWADILGDRYASPPVPPRDPFMVQSVAQHAGANPRTGIAILQSPATAPGVGELGPGGNEINRHAYVVGHKADLQYACIFPLDPPKDCTPALETQAIPLGCDCGTRGTDVLDRPLCNGNLQEYAKAYPGGRMLEVLKGFGNNSIIASICPKNVDLTDPRAPDYGYNPAMDAVVERLVERFRGTCLAARPPLDEQGNLQCRVVEVSRAPSAAPCTDAMAGRRVVDGELAALTTAQLEYLQICGAGGDPCEEFSLCELTPVEGDAASEECLSSAPAEISTATGYCYIDAMTDQNGDGVVECDALDPARRAECIGNPELVASCAPPVRRLLRFVSPAAAKGTQNEVPWPRSTVLVVCPE